MGETEPSNYEENKSECEAMSNNMLNDNNEDPSFVQEQIKKLDSMFDNQGLSGLNDNDDEQKSFDQKKEKLVTHLL
jgi:hypothetical protein